MPPKVTGKEKIKAGESKNSASTLSLTKDDLKDFLANPDLSPEKRKAISDFLNKNKEIDTKAAYSELTKDGNLDNIKLDNADTVAKNLKEAAEGKDSPKAEKEQTTEAKPTGESTKETPKDTKESTVETPKEPKQETPKNEEKVKKVIDGFDSNQFTFKDTANQELYNLALTNGIGTPIRLATGEIAIPITGTGKSMVVSDKYAKTLDKVKRDDPKEVSATLAQILGGSPVKGYDAYNYTNSKERVGTSNYLAKLFKKIDESSLSKEDKEKAKELVNEHPNIFKRLFVGGGLFGTAGLVGMGLYNDNDDQNTIEGIDGLKNRLNQDNPDDSAGVSEEGDSGDYPINLDLPNFGDPGSTADTLESASKAESEGTIGESQDPESTPYNPTYTPKQEMYNSLASSTAEPREAEPTSTENTVDQLKAADNVSNGGSVNTSAPAAKAKTKAKSSKATSGNNALMAGSRPDVSAPGYGAADLSAALGQVAQGAPVDGYDRMFDPSFLEYMRKVSPNAAYGIEQEMRRRGMM